MIYLIYVIIMILLAFAYDFHVNRKAIKALRNSHKLPAWQIPYTMLCIAFICLAGFRYEIGGDTIVYMKLWNRLPPLGDMSQEYLNNSRFQYGFNFLFSAAKSLSENFVVFQIIHATIVNTIIFWIISKFSRFRFTAVLLYFILNFLEFNTEILRESLSVCCGLLAYYNFYKGKKLYGWGLIALAFCFHLSALVLVFIPLAIRIKYSKKLFWVFLSVVAGCMIIWPLMPDITPLVALLSGDAKTLVEFYDIREINESFNLNYYIVLTFKCIILPFVALYITKGRNNAILGMALIYIVLYTLSSFTYAFYRFANYFAIFYSIFFAEALIILVKKINGIPFARGLSYIALICLFIYLTQGYLLGTSPTTGKPLYARYFPYKSQFTEYIIGEE